MSEPVRWDVEQIRMNLSRSQRWVERALVAIYRKQTEQERASSSTIVNNGVGFSAFDAHIGSYLAQWVLKGKPLSGKWLERGRKLAMKYSGQLVQIANSKEA